MRGLLHRAAGEYDAALVALREAERRRLWEGPARDLTVVRQHFGALLLEGGDRVAALRSLTRTWSGFAALHEPDDYHHARVLVDLGRAWLELGDRTGARVVLVDAEARLRGLGSAVETARALLVLADLAHAEHSPRVERDLCARALVLLEGVRSPRARAVCARLAPWPDPPAAQAPRTAVPSTSPDPPSGHTPSSRAAGAPTPDHLTPRGQS
ncbi:hypothetical protein [Saccharothrix australiensis]|uniref:hypothetical protein n=1 Tax=Saccharothrix australiensis TaxID=2072 RepID=UPI000EB29ACC|nr:hypothetical protein [Saccharothrix australiensis]